MSNLTGNISKMWTPFLPVPNRGNLFQSDRFQSINYFIFTLNYIYWTWLLPRVKWELAVVNSWKLE